MLYKYLLSFQCFSALGSTKGAQGLEQCFFMDDDDENSTHTHCDWTFKFDTPSVSLARNNQADNNSQRNCSTAD